MNSYQYANTANGLSTLPGVYADSNAAIAALSGVKDAAKNTGVQLVKENPPSSLPNVNTPVVTPPSTPTGSPLSSTVLTNANIIENTIPDNNSKLDALSKKGITVGGDGLARNADGSLVRAPFGATKNDGSENYTVDGINYGADPNQFAEDDPTNTLLSKMSANIDASTKGLIDSISQKYDLLKQQQKQINDATEAGRAKSLLVDSSGSARYAPLSSTNILGIQQTQDLQEIARLDAEENTQIASARAAQQSGQFQIMEKALDAAQEIRQQKQDQAKKVADDLATQLKQSQANQKQASRDSAIADLYSQGITDPASILKSLNTDTTGKVVGDFTAKEVGDVLTTISKNSGFQDLDKLSSNVRDFYILQKGGGLPSNITSLSPDNQLKAWLNFVKPSTKGTTGTSGNKITLSEAQTKGLPLSTVGRTELSITQDLQSPNVPDWFIEKAQGENGASLTSDSLQSLWDKYRTGFITQTPTKKTPVDNKARATTYFKDAYGDVVDDETVSQLADMVQHYIDGGMTYAKAVDQTIKDASE